MQIFKEHSCYAILKWDTVSACLNQTFSLYYSCTLTVVDISENELGSPYLTYKLLKTHLFWDQKVKDQGHNVCVGL